VYGEIVIDFAASEARVRGELVALTPLEFRLLTTFTDHPGHVLSRDQLLELVWGDSFGRGGDEVKLYVRYLRLKVECDPAAPRLNETVRGFGYRLFAGRRGRPSAEQSTTVQEPLVRGFSRAELVPTTSAGRGRARRRRSEALAAGS
jgi:DNA-binding winged helix-turn-helix (wHTH) protein